MIILQLIYKKKSIPLEFSLNMASLGFIGPPKILGPPLIPKFQVPPLIYLVGTVAISDPHNNICVRPPNTCVALKQFNLLHPNTSV